jgi:hypothetical protein
VNLVAGTATGLTGGVSNFQNVVGSAFNDIVVGGSAGGMIEGRGGRDLLLAGPGPSTLQGGTGDDILIGGSTKLNADELAGLLADWSRLDIDYRTRTTDFVTYIDGHPGDFNANGQSDILNGEDGEDLFLASPQDSGDWINGEVVVQL